MQLRVMATLQTILVPKWVIYGFALSIQGFCTVKFSSEKLATG